MISLNDVLLAMSNIPVDDPIAEIWGCGLQGGYRIIEYTGSLPITIRANGDVLLDYRIYGADGGVGVATENLVDFEAWLVREGVPYTKDGNCYTITGSLNKLYSNPYYFSDTDIYVSISGIMTIPIGSNIRIYIIKRDGTISGSVALGGDSNIRLTQNVLGAGIKFDYASTGPCTVDNLMLNLGRTALPYIPYGYKLPMTVGDGDTTQTVPIYIGENQLDAGEYVSYGEQKIYKHTENLCPPQDSGAWNAGYINTTGNVSDPTSAKEIYSDYIAVSSDQTYNFKNFNSFPAGNAGSWYAVGIYDANKNFILRPASSQYGSNNNLQYHLPSNAAYVRLTFRTYDTIDNQLSFTLGNIPPTQFVPYIMPTNPPAPLPQIPTIDGTTIIDYDGDPKPSQMYVKYKDKSGGA